MCPQVYVLPNTDMARARVLLGHLFSIFDSDNNGYVDASELGAGVSVLCGGSVEERCD